MARWPGFINGAFAGQSAILDAEDTVNLYLEPSQGTGQNSGALLPTPGFTKWSAVTDVSARGMTVVSGRLFAVLGAGLYEFDGNGSATKRGTVANDGLPVQWASNGLIGGQLGIAAGGSIYCYTLATNVLSAALLTGNYSHLSYAAGFGLAFQSTTGKTFLSNLNDLSVWSAGTFFQRSLFADPPQAVFVDANNLVWTIGTDSFEVRYNSGVGTQPFTPLSGLVGPYGIAAPFAYASGTTISWLSRNGEGIGEFVTTRGNGPEPVSTAAVHTAIAGYLRTSKVDDAEVFRYQQEGHRFNIVAFPSAKMSWAHDDTVQSWARRARWTNGAWDVWAPRCHAYFNGMHLVGDRSTGTIWKMDTTIATDIDGNGIRRMRVAPHVNSQHQRKPIDRFEIIIDAGLGLASGQGSDPQAMIEVSRDGRVYGNIRQAGVGKIGEYRKQIFWDRLGAPADAVIRLTYSEPTPFRIVDAFVNGMEA